MYFLSVKSCICFYVPVFVSAPHCLSVCSSICLVSDYLTSPHVFLSRAFSFSLILTRSLSFFFVSLCLSLSLFVSLCLSLSLFVSRCFSSSVVLTRPLSSSLVLCRPLSSYLVLSRPLSSSLVLSRSLCLYSPQPGSRLVDSSVSDFSTVFPEPMATFQ